MDTRAYLLILVGIVGAAQFFASSQTTDAALLSQRDTSERTVERLSALEAAGGVDATRASEAIRCDSLSFAGGGPVCHTPAPQLHIEQDGAGVLRVAAVRPTRQGGRVVARARVRGLAKQEIHVETLP